MPMCESRCVTSKPHRIARSTWARQLASDLVQVGVVPHVLDGAGEPAVAAEQRRRLRDRAPPVQLPLRVERQVHPHVLAPVPRRRLPGPRAGHHQRRRGGQAHPQCVVDTLVGRVAHAQVVAVDDQQAGVRVVPQAFDQRAHGPHATAAPGRSRPPRDPGEQVGLRDLGVHQRTGQDVVVARVQVPGRPRWAGRTRTARPGRPGWRGPAAPSPAPRRSRAMSTWVVMRSSWWKSLMRSIHSSSNGDSMPSSRNFSCRASIRAGDHTV